MADSVTFLATFPDIQSAIKTGKDTVRLQLDVPKSEKQKLLPLYDAFECVLEVTIKVRQSQTYGGTQTRERSAVSPLDVAGG